jgi:diketogulonate reductase-like aldo/keto reductase
MMGSGSSSALFTMVLLLLSLSLFSVLFVVDAALSVQRDELWTRRQALIGAASVTSSGLIVTSTSPSVSVAHAVDDDTSVDLAAFNAARASGGSSKNLGGNIAPPLQRHSIISTNDPSPLLPIRGAKSSTLYIPRVGYSLYKTVPEQVSRCVALALRCGIRHFDVATQYESNSVIGKTLQQYLNGGLSALNKDYYNNEKVELLQLLDETAMIAQRHALETTSSRSLVTSPNIDVSAGRRSRRSQLFLSHKLSNSEQSTDSIAVKRNVKQTIATLGVGYLDLVMIHSPFTDSARRLGTYKALLELREAGFVRSVGVCNYGLGPLMEIQQEFAGGLDTTDTSNLPAINQLELSPFNAHREIVQYCDSNGIAVGCSAWSKLSSVNGPAEGWAVLAEIAKAKGMTKAQVLVRWSLQKGYVCVPRSASSSKVERVAIAENSYGGVNKMEEFVLSDKEMEVLGGLDIAYKAGKLGRRDGWEDEDVTGPEWDPTEFV